MRRSSEDSMIVIWSQREINDSELRAQEDRDAMILQCEPGADGDYIVEILRGCVSRC